MTKAQLIAAINKVLREERRYATGLSERGDMGRAKLAVAAILEIEAALNAAAPGDVDTYAERLDMVLRERQSDYRDLWNDEDGVGGSTFLRVFDLIADELTS